jgi:hypothetical protein
MVNEKSLNVSEHDSREQAAEEAVAERLDKFAWKAVHPLVRAHRDRFREMVLRCMEDLIRRRDNLEDFERRRQKHFEQKVLAEPRLQDEAAGPPQPDWCWEFHNRHRPTTDAERTIKGWTPPDLSRECWPNADLPLPLPIGRDGEPGRELDLAEKYAVLAAVHDCFCNNVEPVDLWRNERESLSVEDFLRGAESNPSMPGMLYPALVAAVREISQLDSERDLEPLADYLADVKDDLEKQAQQNGAEITSQTHSAPRVVTLREEGRELVVDDGRPIGFGDTRQFSALSALFKSTRGVPVMLTRDVIKDLKIRLRRDGAKMFADCIESRTGLGYALVLPDTTEVRHLQ